MYVRQLCVILIILCIDHNFDFVFVITLGPGLKILCPNVLRRAGSVRIVIIPSMTGFQTSKNLTVCAAIVQTLSGNAQVRHRVVFSYNKLLIKNRQHNFNRSFRWS